MKEVILISDRSGEKSIISYDPVTGNQLSVFKHAGTIAPHTLQVICDSYLLAADLTKPRLYLWPLNSQTPVFDVRLPTPGNVSALACTPNGKFAVASIKEKIFLWQICTGRLLATLTGHFQMVTTLKFNADGSIFASAAEDNLIFVWSLGGCANSIHLPENNCKPLHTFSNHSRPVKDICFGSLTKRSLLCSVSLDKSMKMYDTSTGNLLLSLIFNEPLTSVSLDANENYAYIGTISGNIQQFNLRNPPRNIDYVPSNKDIKVFKSHETSVSCISVSADCTMLLSGDDSGKVCIWDVNTRVVTKQITHKGRINNAMFSPAFECYKASCLRPSLIVSSLKWTSEEDDGRLEIISKNESEDLLNYDDYVKNVEVIEEKIDSNLEAENEELKRINNALMKKLMKQVLSNKN